ncbi:polysaccharide deacetylase family protein [Erwinia persicina]|uniref:polysaccharide deacetylase family protein n=1 Tax=Erwinia persicina TaxID=55211 RepID=UPI000E9ABB84|nr:polysaccharide deacetylase family protein [Erwinia persicina]MBD8169575.1 polysaccharide deacetylase family protein [Erwinia persicina]HBH63120.1 deacetylase [Erwinia persicina]HBT11556.1 deacetylase [Erwinia persicina]HBT54918.1 deacetylase [Erwinia persicina]
MVKPAFIITIDTEGDNLWENHNLISTKNTHYLPRFQALCEKYAFKPVYLTNYEMAVDDDYVAFARDVIARGTGEVGMHLHAWNSPPLDPLTDDDWRYKPYLIEYPAGLIRSKVEFMTRLLEDTFQTKMLSHRAGRWAFNEYYAALLIEFGYVVDCSVTPKVNWQFSPGNPEGKGGTNYRDFPSHAYFMDEKNIARAGTSSLLEVPMTIQYKHSGLMNSLKSGYDRLRGKRRSPSVNWLRPSGGNVENMKRVVRQSLDEGHDYVEFMLHSSEFMPGGSPTFATEQHIERLYQDLEQLFSWLSERTVGKTLAEYYWDKMGAK